MTAFHSLAVTDVRPETADTISVAFEVPPELRETYRFAPSQHVTVRHDVEGGPVRRAYSICSAPHEGELRIAIKKIDGGLFSTFAHTTLRPGITLDVGRPAGRLALALDPAATRLYAAFAAGSGITPIIPMIKTVLAEEPKSRVVLFYGNRDASTVIFRDELENLKDQHVSRLSIHHVFSRSEQGSPMLEGHLDTAKVERLAGIVCPPDAVHRYFVCGPATMGVTIRTTLLDLGAEPEQIMVESFGSGARSGPTGRRPTPVAESRRDGATAVITTIADGQHRGFEMALDGETLLDAALRQSIDLPFACKSGVCGACRARVLDGEAEMTTSHALDPNEVDAGFVLACQARPQTPRLVLDFDRAWSDVAA